MKLYDAERYEEVRPLLAQIADGTTGDDEGNRMRAAFTLAKTTYHLKQYAASLAQLRAIVARGRAHLYYPRAPQWLVALLAQLPAPDAEGVASALGAFDWCAVPQPTIVDDLLRLLRDQCEHLGRGVSCRVLGLLLQRGVGSGRDLPPPARFFRAGCELKDAESCRQPH
jgi:hypothetical protein